MDMVDRGSLLHYVQQEQSLHVDARIVGAVAQVLTDVKAWVVVVGPSPCRVVAFTSTGMAAPVLRPKTRCPRTALH
jgi:hypothetical protein